MKQLISRLLGRRPPQDADTGGQPALAARRQSGESLDHQHSMEDNSSNGARRQLLQALFRDCVRKQGIPADWVECQVMEVRSRSRGEGLHARLVIRHWDLRLLTYSYAFQLRLLSAVSRFEPEASTWLHGVSWEFDVGNTCPYSEMPEDSLWRPKPVPAELPVHAASLPAAAVSDSDVLQDLERMFAIRDASIETAVDFQKTEPSKLS
jgi:hypothetical protein